MEQAREVIDGLFLFLVEFVVRLETQHAARIHWQSEICTNMSTLTEMRIKLLMESKKQQNTCILLGSIIVILSGSIGKRS